MKEYQGSVVVIYRGILYQNIPFSSAIEAEKIFLEQCKENINDFEEFYGNELEYILEEGYFDNENGVDIFISWFQD